MAGEDKAGNAGIPAPAGGLTQAQIDQEIKERAEGLANKQLGELKEKWTAQVTAQYEAKIAELEKFKTEIEERDLSELQKAQKAAEVAQDKLKALENNLFQSRWQNAISTALHEAHVAGTSVLSQFVGGVDITGKETPEELTAKAQEAVSAAFESQNQALTAAGYAQKAPGPGQAPGFPPPQKQNVIPVLQQGGPPPPGAVQAPEGGGAAAWRMVKGVLSGSGATPPPGAPGTPGAT